MSENAKAPLTQVLVIGVDGGELTLLEQWMASGDMPNLAALRERSLRGRTRNPYALEAGSVWPTFHTGLLPAHQPQFDGQRFFDSETYTYKWFERGAVMPNLWQHLSAQGKRCLVIDAPYVRLDPTLNGAMILDWGSHVAVNGTEMEFQTHPAELKDEILSAFGPDPTGGIPCDRRKLESLADHRKFLNDYLTRIEKKGELTAHMLRKGGWDYAEIVFTDLHCLGHQMWHIRDETHPKHKPALLKALGDPLHTAYRAFDKALGRILGTVDERTTVLFYASHGMGPQYTGTGLLDKLLTVIESGKPATPAGRPLRARVRDLWHQVPGEVRAALRPLRTPLKGSLNTSDIMPDRSGRRFFEVYANNATGGVRLNLKGREAKGVVDPAEARGILEELCQAILDVRNADTGEPFATECIITRDQYHGDYDVFLPDMLVMWNRSAPIRAIQSPRIGLIHQDYANFRTGDHTPFGMFMASGEGIVPKILNDDVAAPDFAPTLIAKMGGRLEQTDGTTIPALAGM